MKNLQWENWLCILHFHAVTAAQKIKIPWAWLSHLKKIIKIQANKISEIMPSVNMTLITYILLYWPREYKLLQLELIQFASASVPVVVSKTKTVQDCNSVSVPYANCNYSYQKNCKNWHLNICDILTEKRVFPLIFHSKAFCNTWSSNKAFCISLQQMISIN